MVFVCFIWKINIHTLPDNTIDIKGKIRVFKINSNIRQHFFYDFITYNGRFRVNTKQFFVKLPKRG